MPQSSLASLQGWVAAQDEGYAEPEMSWLEREGGGDLAQALEQLKFDFQLGHEPLGNSAL